MPYIDFVQACSAENLFRYNHKAIFAQVRKAMRKSGDKREKALQDILKTNYLKDAKKYETVWDINIPLNINLSYCALRVVHYA